MKINSTIFTIIVISLVAFTSYYIGVLNQSVNPNQQSNTLPIAVKQAKTAETNPEPCIPNYQSENKDNEQIDVNELNKNFKPSMPLSTAQEITPVSYNVIRYENKTIDELVAIMARRYKAYVAVNYANYQKRLLNAGATIDSNGVAHLLKANSALVDQANAMFGLDQAKTENWYKEAKQKLKLFAIVQQQRWQQQKIAQQQWWQQREIINRLDEIEWQQQHNNRKMMNRLDEIEWQQ